MSDMESDSAVPSSSLSCEQSIGSGQIVNSSDLSIAPQIRSQLETTSDSVGAPASNDAFTSHSKTPTTGSLLLSTFLSLVVVLVLLIALRLMLPSMLEFSRYAWYRGQLRAEYEMSGQQLERISWEGLSSVSQTVAKRVCPSVVHIMMSSEVDEAQTSLDEIIRATPRRAKVGQGSGIIVDPKGYILTNYHVLDDGSQINVFLPDERTCQAELVGFDKLTDLAVLKINADEILPISWGDSDCIEVGSPVWAVGSPFGLTGTITFGILSSKHRLDLTGTSYDDSFRNPLSRGDRKKAQPRYSDLMQSDVAVNPGNSGGPLVNGKGEMIGVNTAIIGESYRGVSFAIPSNLAKAVVKQIIETGRMQRGWVGVTLVKASDKNRSKQSLSAKQTSSGDSEISDLDEPTEVLGQAKFPSRGAVVQSVLEGSPAAIAGLQVGDTVLTFNGMTVKGVEDLIFEIGKTPVGQSIELNIDRQGESMQISVTIGQRPDSL